jgi:hypothetical protein
MKKTGLAVACLFAGSMVMFTAPLVAQEMAPEWDDWGDASWPTDSQPQESGPPENCLTLDDDGECVEECDSEDCIDERPNHECETGEEGCSDSDLSIDIEPCSDDGASCEEDEEEDEGSNDGRFPPVRYTHQMSRADIEAVKRLTLQRGHEEVARKGGYLADIDHDNIFGFNLSDTMDPETLSNMLGVSGWYIKRFGLEINIVVYRESLKSMAGDVLGELVQTYPYKRRRCGLFQNVGQGFRWRLGSRLMVEEGVVWNRHISPMVEASIQELPGEIEEQLMEIVREHGLEDHTTIKVTIKRCGEAPGGSGSSGTAGPPGR